MSRENLSFRFLTRLLQLRRKPTCTATEASQRFEILNIETVEIKSVRVEIY